MLRQVRERVVLHVEVADNLEGAAQLLEANPLVEAVQVDHHRITVTLRRVWRTTANCPRCWSRPGTSCRLFSEREVNLESAFMALTKGMGAKI